MLLFNFVACNQKYESPNISPREPLIKALADAGCTNLYVANKVIESYYSGIPVSVLAERLAPITGYSVPVLSKWVLVLSTYIKRHKSAT